MMNRGELIFYILVIVLFLIIIIRLFAAQRQLKSSQEIYLVVDQFKNERSILNRKVFVNVFFLILVILMSAYAITTRMYAESTSSLVSVGFCLGLAYFDWYSSQQKMVVTKAGINIGIDHVNWENVKSYFWKEDIAGKCVLLRVRRKSKMPFSFRVTQREKEKLDQLIASKVLK